MRESQNTPETASNKTAETREPTKSELDQVVALLRGDEPDQGNQADQDGDDQSDQADQDGASDSDPKAETQNTKGKPKNLDELAETLGVKVADLYSIEVPFSVGDDVEVKTLGEIKDLVGKSVDFEVDRLAWEESKTKMEQRILRSNQELRELVSMLPRSALSPQFVQAVAKRRAEAAEAEARATKGAIPEWSDETVEARDREAMREHMGAYGFPDDYLDSILDHRTLKYIRDNMQRQQRIERALAQVKTVRKPGHAPSEPTSKPRANPRSGSRPRSRVRSQVSQVVDLLNS